MNKSVFIFAIVIVLVIITIWFIMQKGKSNYAANESPMPTPTVTPAVSESPAAQTIKYADGLIVQDLVVGTGAQVKAGDTVTVNYVGALADGTVFDASAKHGGPATFQIGVGQLIKGWDEGIPGMKEGGKRKLIIPPSLGYGSQNVGNGLIPPNSTLVFEIELISVKPASAK